MAGDGWVGVRITRDVADPSLESFGGHGNPGCHSGDVLDQSFGNVHRLGFAGPGAAHQHLVDVGVIDHPPGAEEDVPPDEGGEGGIAAPDVEHVRNFRAFAVGEEVVDKVPHGFLFLASVKNPSRIWDRLIHSKENWVR